LGGDQAEVPALARDGDGRGERGGDVGRHGGRWSVVVVVVAAGEVEAWVGLDFPWMRPGGQGGGLPFDVADEWESTGFLLGRQS
jgi:hypothetical protein